MKKMFFLISVLLILIAIPATVFIVGQQQELRKKAAPATILALTPATVNKKVGETFSLDITIDTGENQVVAAEIHIIFDPTKLEAQTITNSSLFPNILTSGVVDRGTASITVAAADAKKPAKGTGSVAVVRLKAVEKTTEPVSVKLAPNTFVGGLGETATNVLVGTTPSSVTITGEGVSPSPTVTLTPTPSASPSAEASPSALKITSPGTNASMKTLTPTIRGKAEPGATITLTIYSTPQTVTIKADANGNWSYTPTAPLEPGSHNVVASVAGPGGTPQTATTNFVVAAGIGGTEIATGSATPTATPTAQPIPVSGSSSWTIMLISIGLIMLVSGVAYAFLL